MMDHNIVIENKTAERYLLGELTDTERDAYEEHYFQCPECAEELRCGSEFMHYAREVVQQDAAQEAVAQRQGNLVVPGVLSRPVWMRAMPAAVFAVLTLGVGIGLLQYQRISGGAQKPSQATAQQPMAEKVAYLEPPGASHGEQEPAVLGRNQPVLLTFRLESADKSPEFVAYEAVIATGAGNELVHKISNRELDDMVEWHLPAGALEFGNHTVKIRAFNREGVRSEVKGKTPEFPFKLVPPKD